MLKTWDGHTITISGEICVATFLKLLIWFSEDVAKRFEAQRWQVAEVDGEDWQGLRAALEAARADTERPSLVITKTTIGYGSPNKANTPKAHGEKLGAEELQLTKEALGWPLEPAFLVPDDVRAWLDERIAEKKAEAQARNDTLAGWRVAAPERAAAWDAAREKQLPENLGEILSEGLDGVDEPTRKHGAKALERLAQLAPWFVGGSADLAGSGAPPNLKDRGFVGRGDDPRSAVGVVPNDVRYHHSGAHDRCARRAHEV